MNLHQKFKFCILLSILVLSIKANEDEIDDDEMNYKYSCGEDPKTK